MDIQDRKGLRSRADAALRQAKYDPKKLIFIHTGASALVLLLIAVVNYYLQLQIADTGGLSGMGTRSILSTVSQTLQLAANLALPFWSIGYTAAVLAIARGREATPEILPEGFRRFGPVVRLLLIRELAVFGLGMLCAYPAALIFMLTPLCQPLINAMLPLMEQTADPYALIEDPAFISAMQDAAVPLMVIFLILFAVVALPLIFRVRFAEMALLDDPAAGAFASLRKSWTCTSRRCGSLLRLDLDFWWFYVLDFAVTVLAYGDVLLTYLGIDLGLDAQLMYFLVYAVYLIAQAALYCLAKNKVHVTYALAYDAIRDAEAPPKTQNPQNIPWNY